MSWRLPGKQRAYLSWLPNLQLNMSSEMYYILLVEVKYVQTVHTAHLRCNTDLLLILQEAFIGLLLVEIL